MPITPEGRRPLKSRDQPFFKNLAASLARAGVSPNAISFSSMIFGAAAGLALAATGCTMGWTLRAAWLASGVFIQLRLIANLLDGMVAVEGRRGGPTGELWNEAPDRVADACIFIGAGYAAGSSPLLGFGAALMAVFVAYVRALGASVGAGQIFIGPMAKPHRMFVLTVLSVTGAIFPMTISHSFTGTLSLQETMARLQDASYVVSEGGMAVTPVTIVLALIILGCVFTALRRLSRIAAFLRSKAL
jgi:phosphatidylglycerophosphate synthase